MDDPLRQLLDVLAGKADPETIRQLEDPASPLSAEFRAMKGRVASALSIRPEVLEEDRHLLPLLKVANECAPREIRLFAPEERTRITDVRVRRVSRPHRTLCAVASATINDSIVIRGIRIVRFGESIGVRMPWSPQVVACPACRSRNRRGAKVCAQCGSPIPRKSRVDTTLRDRRQGSVRIRNKELVARIQKRVLARYQEILEGASPVPTRGEGTKQDVESLKAEPHTLWLGSRAPHPGGAPSGTLDAPTLGEDARGTTPKSPAEPPRPRQFGAATEGETSFPVDHPLLAKYWRPSERLAIVLHWFFLCAQEGRDVPIAEAVASWEGEAGKEWRSERFWRDMKDQEAEIERHKYHLSREAGHDVGREFAEDDWLKNYGEAWRQWREEDIESL